MVKNLDNMKEKGNPCIFVEYSTQSKGYRVYNKRARLIVESLHVNFDEIKEMTKASDYDNSGPLVPNVSPSAETDAPSLQELDLLFSPLYDEFFTARNQCVSKSSALSDNSTQQDIQPTMNVQPTTEPITLTTNVNAKENNNNQAKDAHFEQYEFINPFCTPVKKLPSLPHAMLILQTCIHSTNEELHQFNILKVWELVDIPFGKTVIKLKWLRKNKKDEDNAVIHNKAHLVAKGYAQE
ncbi:retrovirus-related pol polyprotein from transposon TNT 1-94 [Tanacetum coccineum]